VARVGPAPAGGGAGPGLPPGRRRRGGGRPCRGPGGSRTPSTSPAAVSRTSRASQRSRGFCSSPVRSTLSSSRATSAATPTTRRSSAAARSSRRRAWRKPLRTRGCLFSPTRCTGARSRRRCCGRAAFPSSVRSRPPCAWPAGLLRRRPKPCGVSRTCRSRPSRLPGTPITSPRASCSLPPAYASGRRGRSRAGGRR